MNRLRIGEHSIHMPDADQISNVKIRNEYEALLALNAERRKAASALSGLDAARATAAELDKKANRKAVRDGKPSKDPRRNQKAAQAAYDDALANANAYADAEYQAYHEFVAVIEANADQWRPSLIRDAQDALERLTAARVTIRRAEADFVNAASMVGMLERGGTVAPLVSGQVELSAAEDSLTAAIAAAARLIGIM